MNRKPASGYLARGSAVCLGFVLGLTPVLWAQDVPTAGLAALWEFEEGGGPTAVDSSANSNDGALGGYVDDSQWVDGLFGGGLAFNAQTGNRLVVPHHPTIADDLVNAFSVSAWFKSNVPLPNNAATYAVLEKGNMFFVVQGIATGGMNLLIKKGGANLTAGIGDTLAAGVWYHVAGVFDGAEARVYLDGELKGTLAVEAPMDLTDLPLVIGGDDAARTFNGTLDTVAIWNRALTEEEILQVAGRAGAPNITTQPVPQEIYQGGTARFSVSALGESPLSYQWYKDGEQLRNQTGDTLVLEYASLADAGEYWVEARNPAGELESDRVQLSITAVEGLPTGRVLHLPFNETSGLTAADASGQGNGGTLMYYPDNTSHWGPGQVNNSLEFVYDEVNGVGGNTVAVGDSATLDQVTYEATFTFWLKASSYGLLENVGNYTRSANSILRKGNHFGIRLINDPGSVVETIVTRAGTGADGGQVPRGGWEVNAPQGSAVLEEWQHWTVLYRNNTITFYLNGFRVGQPANGVLGLPNDEALAIGGYNVALDPVVLTSPLNGWLDEVSIWARPLSEAEILEVAGRDVAGPPAIAKQPAAQKRIEGTTAVFEVFVTGKQPLAYQWMKDGAALPGEVSSALVLNRLQPSAAGAYTVEISNSEGSVTSEAASLEVEALDAITSGLVAYYKFDDGPGTTLTDSSGNNLHGLLKNMDDASRVSGLIGGAFQFDGTDDYIVIDHSPLLDLTTEATIAVWLNIDFVSTTWDRVFRKGTTYDFVLMPNGVIQLNGVNKNPYPTPAGSWELNLWTHYAYTVRNGVIQWYRNGEPLGAPLTGALGELNTGPLVIANFEDGLAINRPYRGTIDDLGIWQRALSDGDILGLYVNGAQGNPLDQEFEPLSISRIAPVGGGVEIDYYSPFSDRPTQIESKAAIEDPAWTVAEAAIVDKGQGTFTATVDLTGVDVAFFRVATIPPPPLFSDDFETAIPGWTHGGMEDKWERGVPTTGPGAAYSPENVYATGLAENLGPFTEAWLRTPDIDLTGVSSATLSFAEWLNVDFIAGIPIDDQYHKVTVNVLDASSLNVIQPEIYVNSGNSNGWQVRSVRLVGAAVGQVVKLEFRIQSDDFNLLEGWFLDDVVVRPN